MRTIQPDKVVLARESRGLTQAGLAERLSVSQAMVSKIEAGIAMPEATIIEKLASTLGYPLAFFFQVDPVIGAGPSELYHRKRQTTPSKLLRKVYAEVNVQRMHIARLLRSLDVACNVPKLTTDEFKSPEDIARAVRAMWHVPPGPIGDLVALVEANGALVLERHFGSPLIDGMSLWLPTLPPMFFMNVDACRSRRRLTLAHELGHSVMHAVPTPTMEEEANRFAAEFLMPDQEVAPYLVDVSLPRLAELKLYWKTSMAALLHRASDLEKISKDQATLLWKRLSKAGYRRNEPLELDLPDERPSLFREMIETHRRTLGYSLGNLAELLVFCEEELRQTYLPDETRLRVVPKRA
jgi:Zn-dependent peptidase ImmA (M78 family)/transcriptional regulator with XRE-family HTH domain